MSNSTPNSALSSRNHVIHGGEVSSIQDVQAEKFNYRLISPAMKMGYSRRASG